MHDFFGLTDHIRGVSAQLSTEGFVTFAPDLYRGQVASNRDEAAALARDLAWNRVAIELGMGIAALKYNYPDLRVGILGFAMGGAAALVAAASVADLACAVTFYGIPQDVEVENRQIKIQGHFGTRDPKCTPERVSALAQSLTDRGVAHELFRYDADNSFFNPTRPHVYSAADAQIAWRRTVTFLRANLSTEGE